MIIINKRSALVTLGVSLI